MRIDKKAEWIFKYTFRKYKNFVFTKDKKSIALIVNSFDKGGLEQVVLNLYNQYRKLGYKAYILVQNDQVGDLARYLKDQRHLYVFNNDMSKFLEFCWRKKIDILHYHYNVYGLEKLKKLGFKTIYTLHNVYAWMNDEEIMERARLLAHADHIVAVSKFVKDYFCKRTHTESERVKVILNGIDFFELDESRMCSISKELLGIGEGDITFVNIASFHRGKHQAVMIGAMERVIVTNTKIKVLFVGGKGDIEYFNEMMDMLDKSPSKNNIKYVSYLDRAEIGYFLRNIGDVFLLPSIQEGCSNAVLEALYCGMPMILSRVGNAEDIYEVGSVLLVSNAFDDVTTLTMDGIVDLSRNSNTRNVDELSEAILNMANQIGKYKLEAEEKSNEALKYSAAEMTKKYMHLI